jgi:hypothetical protein
VVQFDGLWFNSGSTRQTLKLIPPRFFGR